MPRPPSAAAKSKWAANRRHFLAGAHIVATLALTMPPFVSFMEFFPSQPQIVISARHWGCHSRGIMGDGDVTVRRLIFSAPASAVTCSCQCCAFWPSLASLFAITQSNKEALDLGYTSYKCPSRPWKTNQIGDFLCVPVCTFPSLALPVLHQGVLPHAKTPQLTHSSHSFIGCIHTTTSSRSIRC